ncbi:MAG TPA: molecular chaperone DnaJ, partial [Coxiellaceae bacterium]|nr:molecular chaperone DnaJ [Coxiellaceae bacterium]
DGMAGAGAAGFEGMGGVNFSDVFGDIFGDIFGARGGGDPRKRERAERGHDLITNIRIRLEEAVHGTESTIKVPQMVNCEECGGTGSRKGTKPVTCKTCGGSGQVYIQQGFFSIQQTCHACHGAGEVISDPCHKCHGKGQTQIQKTLSVKIPAGVDDGDRVRLTGEGNAGYRGAPSGDLYVQITVEPHKIFKREGLDLYCDVPVTFVGAALGEEYEIPTLEGKVKLKIPAETQSGKMLRLAGKGIKGMRGGHGNLFCRVVVETPINLSSEQKEVLHKFDELLSKDRKKHSPIAKGWFDAVKDFFGKFAK